MRIDVRWIADYRNETHLSVQYIPVLEGLDPRTSESLHTPRMLRPFPPELAGDLAVLAKLSAELADTEMAEVEGRPWSVEPHVIERTVTPSYGPHRYRYWLRFDFFLRHPLGLHDRLWHEWEEGELPSEVKSIVRRVDEFASAFAHRDWAEHYNEFAANHEVQRYLPGPARMFVSYRAAREEICDFASKVHDSLSAHGDESFFQVFLDRPDLRSGEWKPQLEERIAESDVFVPLLTPDYESGETAFWELELALTKYRSLGKPKIVPVLVEGGWGEHSETSVFQGVMLPLESDEGLFRDQLGRLRSLVVDAVAQSSR